MDASRRRRARQPGGFDVADLDANGPFAPGRGRAVRGGGAGRGAGRVATRSLRGGGAASF